MSGLSSAAGNIVGWLGGSLASLSEQMHAKHHLQQEEQVQQVPQA